MYFRPYSNENIDLVKDKLFAAFDIGTSTIVCAILDGSNGREIMRVVDNNPQNIYGKDMEARIQYGLDNPEHVTAMKEVLLHTIARMLHQATENLGMTTKKIVLIGIAASSGIRSILQGLSIKVEDGHFAAPKLKADTLRADSAGFRVHNYGMALMLPRLGGVLGSDLMADIVATRIYEKEETSLIIDIGTSARFVFGNKDRLVCMSASEKGTGFDGTGISFGLYGTELVETISHYMESGKIDKDGTLLIHDDILNQQDIARIRQGKSITMSALKHLLKELQVDVSEIDHVYLSGTFGLDTDPDVFFKIGLLPVQLRGKLQLFGNAVLEGCKMCVNDYELFLKTAEIADMTEHIECHAQDLITDDFVSFQEYAL